MTEEVPSMCRVCLKECSGEKSIFDYVNNEMYCDLLKKYTGTEINNDKHPCNICEGCSMNLIVLVKFVRKFRSTTKKLKKAKIKRENNSVREVKSEVELNEEIKEESKEVDNKMENYTITTTGKLGAKKTMIQCLICGVMVQNKSAFVVHYRKHSGEKPCVCKHCGRGFTQSGSLNEHIKTQHEGAKTAGYRYTCENCGKQFWRRGALTVHMRTHTNEKPYQCSYCPRAFAQFSEHLLHTRTHTGHRPHTCIVCSKAFISHSALRRHRTVHEDERRFVCNICDIRLKSKESLKKHMCVMHIADKRNVCNVCGAKFSLKYNLTSHMKLRHSDKSGTCSVCNKSFSNLNKHMNSHTADTFISCSICNKKFLKEKALQLHIAKYHNDLAPSFGCSFKDCSATFVKQSKLNFHISKSHTDNNSHVCEICSKEFCRLVDFKKHLKFNHENNLLHPDVTGTNGLNQL